MEEINLRAFRYFDDHLNTFDAELLHEVQECALLKYLYLRCLAAYRVRQVYRWFTAGWILNGMERFGEMRNRATGLAI